ncbi:MAG: hypothetical protein H7Y03_01165 [Chitinophagaceae bacterium]|nr:hypothetical protein [Chitinophagaceae bacterium]
MTKKKQILTCIIFTHFCLFAVAQDTTVATKPQFAIEARVTTYLQGGYDLGAFYYPKNSRLSFGVLVAGHDISGNTKELLFSSNDHDKLDMRLSWIVSLQTRYHFAKHREGFFGEAGVGIEEFSVASGNSDNNDINGFIAPAFGYIWYPWQRDGFYLMPKLATVFTLFREDEQTINETRYQLKSFFLAPSLSIGWKF